MEEKLQSILNTAKTKIIMSVNLKSKPKSIVRKIITSLVDDFKRDLLNYIKEKGRN